MPVTAILFDLDETLFDHEGASAEAVGHWLADRGVQLTPELLDGWFRSERVRFDEYVDGFVSFEQQRRNRIVDLSEHAGLAIPEELASLDALFYEFIRLYEDAWRAFPDARPAVLAARDAGLGVGMLTNGQSEQQRAKVVRTGLADLFPTVAVSADLGVAKPAPEAFWLACEHYGFDPATTAMVGDNHRADVLGARAAGLAAVYLDRRDSGIADPVRLTDLTTILDTIKELP